MPTLTSESGILSHLHSKMTHSPTGDASVLLHIIAMYQLEASVRLHGLEALTETWEA